MESLSIFRKSLKKEELAVVRRLTTPAKIQLYIDELPYSPDETYRAPLRVIRDHTAHCYDGSVFAAAALSWIGYEPLIINMFPNNRDDEHLVAAYKRDGAWGAVAQSNFVGLRYREPIHKTLRELMISYFEQYYNVAREKTMRSYTRPLNLNRFDGHHWMTDDSALDVIADYLNTVRRYPILTRKMVAGLSMVDERSHRAGLEGSVPEGLFKV
jgi:hypothetical protein